MQALSDRAFYNFPSFYHSLYLFENINIPICWYKHIGINLVLKQLLTF